MDVIADIYERWGAQGCLALAVAIVLGAWTLRWLLG